MASGRPVPNTRASRPGLAPKPQPPFQQGAAAAVAAASLLGPHGPQGQHLTDARAKTVLKEAVDAVVNSFAKHTHGYGRGTS